MLHKHKEEPAPEPRFLDPERKKHNHTHLTPLFMIDTRLDTIVGIAAVLFAVIATLGWLIPQVVEFLSS